MSYISVDIEKKIIHTYNVEIYTSMFVIITKIIIIKKNREILTINTFLAALHNSIIKHNFLSEVVIVASKRHHGNIR